MEAFTGKLGSFDTKSAYSHSFGVMPDGTVYANPLNNIDMRPDLKALCDEGMKRAQMKAFGTTSTTGGGSGTAGIGLVPVYVDPRIVDITRKYAPLVEIIPRVTNIGLTADYNRITAKEAAVTAAEDAALEDQDTTVARASTSIKYLYSVGRVTGQAQASYPSYILEGFQGAGSGLTGSVFSPLSAPNAKQLQVLIRARAMREKEESLIVNGNASTAPNDYSGIVTLQGTDNKVDKDTTAIAYDDLETAIQYAFDDGGRPGWSVASSSVVGDLRKIMIDTFRYRPSDMTTTLPFGVSSHLVLETMVGPIPVIPSMYLSNTSGSKAIYFMDPTVIEMRVLQDMTYEDLAKTNDSQKFMLKIYEALIIKNTAFNAWIGEISA